MSPVGYEFIQRRDVKTLSRANLKITYPDRGIIPEQSSRRFILGSNQLMAITVEGTGHVQIADKATNEQVDDFTFDQKDNPITLEDTSTGQILILNYRPKKD